MELIRTLREKNQTKRQQDIEKSAVELFSIEDFDDSLYISYRGMPMRIIEKDWTSERILEELSSVRKNYIKAMNSQTAIVRTIML